MNLTVSFANVTLTSRVIRIANNIPNEFLPPAPVSGLAYDTYNGNHYYKNNFGVYPYGKYIYACDRDTDKFPNWSDVPDCAIVFTYISKE